LIGVLKDYGSVVTAVISVSQCLTCILIIYQQHTSPGLSPQLLNSKLFI